MYTQVKKVQPDHVGLICTVTSSEYADITQGDTTIYEIAGVPLYSLHCGIFLPRLKQRSTFIVLKC